MANTGTPEAAGPRGSTRGDKRRAALVGAIVLLVALVAFNTVSVFTLGWLRADLTQEGLYTISPGVRDTVRSLDEPVRLDLYWTAKTGADAPQVRSHAQRVREFLEALAAESDGKVLLTVIDPEPFSEAEDAARAAGIAALSVDGAGRTLSLGLVVRGSTDASDTIAYLSPEQEPFLEYEVARRILAVGRGGKAKVAVLNTVEPPPFNPQNPMQPQGPPVLIQQLGLLFDVVPMAKDASEVPADVTALVLIQPRELSDATLKAIDAWAVAGKPLLVFADPWAETDPAAQSQGFGNTGAGTTYDLGPLLGAWGIDIPKDSVVGDRDYATRIRTRTQGGQVIELNYLPWLSLKKAAFSGTDPTTAALAQLNLMSVGEIKKTEGGTTAIDPLIESSEQSQLIQTLKLGFFGDPDRLVKDFKPDGTRKPFAARVRGPITSAYPPEGGEAAKGELNLILVADADLFDDQTWLMPEQIAGQSLGFRPLADNGAFVVSAVEAVTGAEALSKLRTRGQYRRPFDRVEAIRKDAEATYLAEEQRLRDEVQKTEMRIGELQRQKVGEGTSAIILSPEQEEEIKRLEETAVDARKKLRDVQHSLGRDIERLGKRLMIINVVGWPLVIAALATVWYLTRFNRQRTPPSAHPKGGSR
jgi:ABC-type uncharacterized transport system involved in gliding motility auxiliary subunit